MGRHRPLGAPLRALVAATALANLGDGLALFLLPVMAVGLTDSPGVVAGVTVLLYLAWPVFGLHAGAIVDRVDRRRLLVAMNAVRAVVVAVVAAASLAGAASIALLYAAALVLGVVETLVDTGLTTMVPAVVGRADRTRANARVEAARNVTNQFVGPPLAGALAAHSAALAGGVAGLAFGGAVVATGLVEGTFRPSPAPGPTTPADPAAADVAPAVTAPAAPPARGRVTAGLVVVWRDPLLRVLTLVTAAMNLLWAAWEALIVVHALDGRDGMGLSEGGYGALLTVMAVGGLAGSLGAEVLVRRLGTRLVLALDLIGTALLVAVPGLTTGVVATALAVLVGGAGSAVWRVVVATLRQDLVPDELLGRVYSASRTLSFGALPLGAALAGVAAEVAGVRATFVTAGVLACVLLAGGMAAITPALRAAERRRG